MRIFDALLMHCLFSARVHWSDRSKNECDKRQMTNGKVNNEECIAHGDNVVCVNDQQERSKH